MSYNPLNPNGQATSANSAPVVVASDQSNLPTNIKQINSSTLSLGQTTGSASLPVVVASDQSNLPTNIKQINSSTLSLGQTTGSASLPVVVASDQASIPVAPNASTTGGATPIHYVSAASTNATSTKTSAGSVYNIQAFNNSATIGYLKFYNKASAPTVGSDTPVTTILIPANSNGAGVVVSLPVPKKFSNGIAWALTANIADTDTNCSCSQPIYR